MFILASVPSLSKHNSGSLFLKVFFMFILASVPSLPPIAWISMHPCKQVNAEHFDQSFRAALSSFNELCWLRNTDKWYVIF